MFNKRGLMLVLLSVVIAAGAAWVANNYVKTKLASAIGGETATVSVVAAAMKIPYGTKIESRHVKIVDVPVSILPPGAVREFKDIDGSVVKGDILDGEIILTERIAGAGAGSSLAALVEPNKRAVTVRVNDVIGVAGFLLPGNFVDVLGTRLETSSTRLAVTETIINMVKVLAVDQTVATSKNEPVVVRAVTLELDPKQAELLVQWEEQGTIQLALRNPTDTLVLVAQQPPPPAAAPAPRRAVKRAAPTQGSSVILIRGTKVQNEKADG